MSEERKPMYALIVNGEWESLDEDRESMVDRAKMWVMEKIGDHYRHGLPLKVTKEIARDVDTYIYKLTNENLVELPLQAWFDEYHSDSEQSDIDEEMREWERYLELAEKFKDRIAKERAS